MRGTLAMAAAAVCGLCANAVKGGLQRTLMAQISCQLRVAAASASLVAAVPPTTEAQPCALAGGLDFSQQRAPGLHSHAPAACSKMRQARSTRAPPAAAATPTHMHRLVTRAGAALLGSSARRLAAMPAAAAAPATAAAELRKLDVSAAARNHARRSSSGNPACVAAAALLMQGCRPALLPHAEAQF